MRRLISQLGVLAVAALASTLAFPAAAQPDVQAIVVRIEIEAPSFGSFSASSRESIESGLAAALAEHGSSHFPFVAWSAAPVSSGSEELPELRGRIVQDDGSRPLPRISLRFEGVLAGSPLPLPAVAELVLYSEQQPIRPTHDPQRLEQDVERALQVRFGDEDFRKAIHGDFLSHVPLARELDVAPEKHRVLLPIHWQRSRIGFDSRLRVKFEAPGQGGGRQPGTMKLGKVERSLAPPLAGGLEAAVLEFSFAPVEPPEGRWDDAIPGIMSGSRVEGVYMESYSKNVNRGIEGDLVTRPD